MAFLSADYPKALTYIWNLLELAMTFHYVKDILKRHPKILPSRLKRFENLGKKYKIFGELFKFILRLHYTAKQGSN